jgi:hypothetical protein
MLDVVIGKGGHEVVTMIVLWLVANVHPFHTSLSCRFGEVLGKQLTLFVKIVPRPLESGIRQSSVSSYQSIAITVQLIH